MPSIDTSSTSDSSTSGSTSGAVVSTSGASLRVVSGMRTSERTATGGMPRTLTRAPGPRQQRAGRPAPTNDEAPGGPPVPEVPQVPGRVGGSVVGTVATGAVVVGAAVVRAVPTTGAVVVTHVVTDRVVGTAAGRALVVTHVMTDRVVGTVRRPSPCRHPRHGRPGRRHRDRPSLSSPDVVPTGSSAPCPPPTRPSLSSGASLTSSAPCPPPIRPRVGRRCRPERR